MIYIALPALQQYFPPSFWFVIKGRQKNTGEDAAREALRKREFHSQPIHNEFRRAKTSAGKAHKGAIDLSFLATFTSHALTI